MRYLALLMALATLAPFGLAKDEFKAGEFVRRQLESIGTEQARDAAKTRVAQGTATFSVLNKSAETWQGSATFVAEGDQLASLMKFPPTVYRTEWFVSNGKKTSVAQVRPGTWTQLGRFVMVHDEILKEGLWGGVFSTGWALARFEENHARLEDQGLKKVDGRELRRVDYFPKKSSDLEIQLYFEPDTLRHVMTVYLLTVGAHSGRNFMQPGVTEDNYRLEERFSDFRSVDNLTLPGRWTIQFTFGGTGSGTIDQYDVKEEKITDNMSVDPRNFEVK